MPGLMVKRCASWRWDVAGARRTGDELRRLTAALVTATALLVPGAARADDTQEYEFGKTRFDRGQYEEAAERFAAMLDAKGPPCGNGPTDGGCRITDKDLIERARALYAASLVALGRLPEADAQIEDILRNNPAYVASPAMFPQEVIDRFTVVRGRLRDALDEIVRQRAEKGRGEQLAAQRAQEAEGVRVAELERLASQETVVTPSSRWVALVPFGVGQLQNGDTALGILFAGGEAAAGVTSIVTAAIAQGYSSIDPSKTITLPNGTRQPVYDPAELNASAQTAVLANRVAFGIWAGLTVIGIVQAQVAFSPERAETRPRKIPAPAPKRAEIVPSVSMGPEGVAVGLTGRF